MGGINVQTKDVQYSDEFRGEKSIKYLEASYTAMEYQKTLYQETQERVAQGEPLIWINVGVPMEIMFAMDIPILFNLNWSALLAAKQMAPHYLDIMNGKGYFRDLCRYCSLPFGYFLDDTPGEKPWGGIPKPTALVVEVIDDPILRIWELMAKKLDVPLYLWDQTYPTTLPPSGWCQTPEDIEKESHRESWRVDYAVKETQGLISFLETVTGKSLSEAKLMEVMTKSNEQFDYIGKVLDLCAGSPAVMGMGDHIANLISTQFYRGHEFGLAQAKRLYLEVEDRVEKGTGICDNEKIRLMHFGVPNWFTPGFFDSFQDEYGAVIAWMGYLPITQQFIRKDLSDPLRALASRYVNYSQTGLIPPWSIQFFIEYAKKYNIDGVIYQRADCCRLLSGNVNLLIKAFKDIGIPTVVMSNDYVDARDWDNAKMKALISNFIETLL